MRHVPAGSTRRQPVSHDPGLLKSVWLGAGEVAGLTQLARTRLPAGTVTCAHAHTDMTELFILLEGRLQACIDGRELTLAAGDCLVVAPGESHHLHNPGPGEADLIHFGLAPSTPGTRADPGL